MPLNKYQIVAAEMQELGYDCDATLVKHVANHDLDSEEGPIPSNAALAANILTALEEHKSA